MIGKGILPRSLLLVILWAACGPVYGRVAPFAIHETPAVIEARLASYTVVIAKHPLWPYHPSEIFVELGLSLKNASPFANTLILELANDNPNYVPNQEAFVEGDYEVVNSRLKPGGGEMLVAAAIRMLKELNAELQ